MSRGFKLSVLLTVVAVLGGVAAVEAAPGKLANPNAGPAGIEWRPVATEMGLVLTVSGPQGFYLRQEYGPGQTASFSVFDSAGAVRPAGSYKYELRAVPQIDEATRAELQAARESGTEPSVLGKAGRRALEVQSGAFAIAGGTILMGGETEPGAGKPAGSGGNQVATKDQVIPDDLIVQGSICAGFDCVNNENFGFDTLRLKENNTRIQFDDTSSTTGFATNNWQIRANASSSGGGSFLAFVDQGATGTSETGTIVFSVEAGAAANALVVDSTSRIGMRTSTPVLDIHIATSNTPGIRLEQTSAGGFTAQTWDIAGNEANFFVRDVTGGSRLPFRIRPQAPTSSLDIAASGNVGIGTASPTRALHVIDTGAADDTVLEIQNNGATRIRINNSSTGETWNIGHQSPSGTGLVFSDVGDAVSEMLLDVSGNMTLAGSLTVGPGGCTGCDLVFSPDYKVESIEEHAAYMWENSHLPGVGPTPEDAPMNLSQKTGGILNELEKAHIYIEQLHGTIETLETRLGDKEGDLSALADELAALKAAVEELRVQR